MEKTKKTQTIDEEKYTVYIHKFPNGKLYIGITKQNPETRWQRGNGYVRNEYMHRAIEKYGWDNIEHIIFSENINIEDACEIEKNLISKYETNKKEKGYNILEGGQHPHITKEMKEKLCVSHTGKKASEETKNKMRYSRNKYIAEHPGVKEEILYNMNIAIEKAAELHSKKVVQFDMEWKKIAVWESMREAERCLGIQHSHISKCCKHIPKYNSAGGYRWEYYADK